MLMLACCLAAPACAPHATPPSPSPEAIELSLFLIGDAGEPDPRGPGAPLEPLAEQLARIAERAVVVFLGDNVYPDGIPEHGAADWADARRRLEAQVHVVPPGARGIFVPGNHDWATSGAFGLYAVRLQEQLIAELAAGRDVRLLPGNGCPGPVSVDAGRLRLVLLDTQWWLHPYIVRDADSDCSTNTTAEVTAALRAQVRPTRAGQIVVVAAHHPLMTGGEHGGYCGITGPFHRFARRSQDVLSTANRRMRDSLESAFAEHPPLVFAAGHDHNLQVLRSGRNVGYMLVSGAGAQSRVSCAVRMRESYYVAQHRTGFMRLDLLRGRGALLSVYRYDGRGRGGLAYTQWLELP